MIRFYGKTDDSEVAYTVATTYYPGTHTDIQFHISGIKPKAGGSHQGLVWTIAQPLL